MNTTTTFPTFSDTMLHDHTANRWSLPDTCFYTSPTTAQKDRDKLAKRMPNYTVRVFATSAAVKRAVLASYVVAYRKNR